MIWTETGVAMQETELHKQKKITGQRKQQNKEFIQLTIHKLQDKSKISQHKKNHEN